jgi:ribosome-binding ATPase YchF (GTP1/OBG family)
MSLADTFSEMFADWSEQDATEELEFIRTELAKVDTARAANDWETLKKLGYANRIDHPTNEMLYRWEFLQAKYDSEKETLALTPAQLAARHNRTI